MGMCRSLDTLQGRGLISEERSMSNTDPFYDSRGSFLTPAACAMQVRLTHMDDMNCANSCFCVVQK